MSSPRSGAERAIALWSPKRAPALKPAAAKPKKPAPAFPAPPPSRLRLEPAIAGKALAAADWAILTAAAQLAFGWAEGGSLVSAPLAAVLPLAAAFLAVKAGFWLTASYDPRALRGRAEGALGGAAIGAILAIGVNMVTGAEARMAAACAVVAPAAALAIGVVHLVVSAWLRRLRGIGALAETLALAGADESAALAIARSEAAGLVRLAAVATDRRPRGEAALIGVPVSGDLKDLLAWPDLKDIDRIVVSLDDSENARNEARRTRFAAAPAPVDYLVAFHNGARRFGERIVWARSHAPDASRIVVKRGLDMLISALALMALAPLFALIWAGVRLESRGPAFVRERARGPDGRSVWLWGFRTHFIDADPAFAAGEGPANDPGGVTFIGRLLNATGVSQWPRLVNVLRGTASLVGPAPEPPGAPRDRLAIRAVKAEFAQRHRLACGLTGWAQIHRRRGDASDDLRRDLEYVAHASVWLDAWIIAAAVTRGAAKTVGLLR